jgi:hypothetical protein
MTTMIDEAFNQRCTVGDAVDYGYGDSAPSTNDTSKYGYGDTSAPVSSNAVDYGYGDAGPDPVSNSNNATASTDSTDYGYGTDLAADPSRTRRERPRRRGSVTKFSLEEEQDQAPPKSPNTKKKDRKNRKKNRTETVDQQGDAAPDSGNQYGYGDAAPGAADKYGYGDTNNAPAEDKYGYGDTTSNNNNTADKYGYGDTNQLGYGSTTGSAQISGGSEAPRRPRRRGSVTKYSLEAQEEVTNVTTEYEQHESVLQQFRNNELQVRPVYETIPLKGDGPSAQKTDDMSEDGLSGDDMSCDALSDDGSTGDKKKKKKKKGGRFGRFRIGKNVSGLSKGSTSSEKSSGK